MRVETGSEHLTLSRPSPVPIGRAGCTAAPSKARASCHASKPSPSYYRRNAKQSQDNPIRQRALWGSTLPWREGETPYHPRGGPPPSCWTDGCPLYRYYVTSAYFLVQNPIHL